MHTRLEEVRLYSKLSKKDFAKKLNISEQAYNNYSKGKRKLQLEQVTILKQLFNISTDWLIIGTGTMFKNTNENINYKEENLKMIENLNEKKQEIYYHRLKADIIEDNK